MTDTNLSEVTVNPQRFPGAEVQSKIFVRNMDGKPCLIWGENKEPDPTRNYQTTITEVIFYDPELKKKCGARRSAATFRNTSSLIRLEQGFSQCTQTGEIFCLDRETQTMSSFARTGVKAGSHSYAVMVDAN